ncbi:hypothetical protein D3C76_1370280 [compost metagenome]
MVPGQGDNDVFQLRLEFQGLDIQPLFLALRMLQGARFPVLHGDPGDLQRLLPFAPAQAVREQLRQLLGFFQHRFVN